MQPVPPPPARSPGLVLALALLALGPWAGAAASEGQTRAPLHVVHLDPGPLAGRTSWILRVERGDTLSELAKQRLGSARRTAEVQRLNPDVDARALRVGQVLRMPPRRPDPAQPWVHFYVAIPGGVAQPILADLPATLPLGPVRVYAVPDGRLRSLQRAAGKQGLTAAALFADEGVAVSDLIEVPRGTGAWPERAVTMLRVLALEGRALRLTLADQRVFGPEGARVALQAQADAEGGSLAPLLFALAGLALFGVLAWALRRSREPA